MKNFIKKNWFKISFLLIIIFVIYFGTYLLLVQPSHIKQECSWTKKHVDYYPGITKEEAEKHKERCIREANDYRAKSKLGDSWYKLNMDACDKIKMIEPKEANDWYEKATPDEYQFCLHSKGL